MNPCIHSGANDYTANTVWYNYATASAGTITGNDNMDIAAESICPNGWTLPSSAQLHTIGGEVPNGISTYVSSFSPIGGGYFNAATLYHYDQGFWMSSEASRNGASRWYISYGIPDGLLSIGKGNLRSEGHYIRCVQAP